MVNYLRFAFFIRWKLEKKLSFYWKCRIATASFTQQRKYFLSKKSRTKQVLWKKTLSYIQVKCSSRNFYKRENILHEAWELMSSEVQAKLFQTKKKCEKSTHFVSVLTKKKNRSCKYHTVNNHRFLFLPNFFRLLTLLLMTC